jgi:hypothetical protein
MKYCKKCQTDKEITEFARKRLSPVDGRQLYSSDCKACKCRYQKNHSPANKEKMKIQAKKWQNQFRIKTYTWLVEQAKDGCIECGETDFVCLQFDHIDPSTKIGSVSTMVANKRSLKLIKEEVAKCQVLCANCHQRRTAKQQGWYAGVEFTYSLTPLISLNIL